MKDINFNTSYGDISFTSGKLDFLVKDSTVVLQKIIQVLKTNFGDYKHFPEYGAGIEDYLGRPVSRFLADQIQKEVLDAINYEEVLPRLSKSNLPYIIKGNSIYYRLMIEDLFTLKLNFDRDKGFKIEEHP